MGTPEECAELFGPGDYEASLTADGALDCIMVTTSTEGGEWSTSTEGGDDRHVYVLVAGGECIFQTTSIEEGAEYLAANFE
jgi:hypothetical protein